ncbi:MAG: hypothetical protein ABGX15_22265, partial [Paracoccaceae bacterium]
RPILPARRPSCLSKFVPPRLPQLPPPPRLAPQPRLSAAGEGAFTVITKTPQPFFSGFVIFSSSGPKDAGKTGV